MRLFGAPSAKQLQTLRDNVQVGRVAWPIEIHSQHLALYCVHLTQYAFPTLTSRIDRICIEIIVDDDTAILPMYCNSLGLNASITVTSAETVKLHLDQCSAHSPRLVEGHESTAQSVALIRATDFRMKIVDLATFNVVVKRFSFNKTQSERPTLFSLQRNRLPSTGTRVHPVVPIAPPPSLNIADLHDRLRALLSPPIHEVLSDPQLALPEVPFPFQAIGIKWLYDRDSALLADEMGLGKSMQAIIAARLLWRDAKLKQVLVVAPKSLIPNWRRELAKWWPGIESYTATFQGDPADRQRFLRMGHPLATVKLINYEALRCELDWLKERECYHDIVIIDEAQRIKNRGSGVSQAVKALKAGRRWALTGTPLENSKDDLVSIFGFVKPGLIKEKEDVATIRGAIKPYMLRRKQEEVLSQLPEVIEQDIEVELGERQRAAYNRAELEGIVALNAKGDEVTITHVFALINKLRQICNFDPITGDSAKADLVMEELEEILESNRKALIFGQFVDESFGLRRLANVLKKWNAEKGRAHPLEYHGEIRPGQRESVEEQFQKDPTHQILLLNYTVGGVGLNLHAANYVFLFDRWWNPAVEAQAVKRCHRLGQHQRVFAKRLFCTNTIEERILKKLEEKRRLFSFVIDEDRPEANVGLSQDEIFSLFKLNVRSKQATKQSRPVRVILDNLDFKQFENLVGMVYEGDGCKVEVTGRSHDGGVDILAERATVSGTDRIVVQCKHQKQNVGRPVLQQLWGVVHSDPLITRCDVVTSAGFTAEAQEFARGKRLTLIDRAKLEELARKLGIATFESPSGSEGTRNNDRCESRGSRQGEVGAKPTKRHRSPLDRWDGSMTLADVREKLRQSGEFRGGWERFLDYLELPVGVGLTSDTTVAKARLMTSA